jgi:membrane-bound metal-dependent hydrolase YbcI (DUF457 family)
MASPVAHSFAGLWTFLLLADRLKLHLIEQWRKRLAQLGMLVLVANLADFDFIPELLFRQDYHRGFSHSLLSPVTAAFFLAGLWKIAGTFWASAGIYFIAYASHLLVDFFTGLQLGWNHSGSGIPLFWPFWPNTDFASLLVLVYGVRHGGLEAILSLANLRAVCYDMLVCGSLTAVLLLWRARYLLKMPSAKQQDDENGFLLRRETVERK